MTNLTPDEEALLNWLRHGTSDPYEAMMRPLQRGRRTSRYSDRPPRPPKPPEPGTLAGVLYELGNVSAATAERAARDWAAAWLTPAEARDWLGAGMEMGDLHLIVELREHGVPPEALRWSVNGDTILDKLKIYGRTVPQVAALLRREGKLRPLTA